MVNNIKLYFYRFSKSSSSVVCLILLFMFQFFPPVLSFLFLIASGADPADFDAVNVVEEFVGQFELITLLILIFSTVFFANDEKNGFIKNMISVQSRKFNIYISRAVFLLIYLTAAVVFSFIIYFISYKLFFHDTVQFEITSELMAEYGIMMLVSYAILLATATIAVASGGTALPLTLGILYILNFFALFIVFLNVLVNKITGSSTFDASCILLPNFYDYSFGSTLQKLLVPSLYIVVSSVISMLILEKRDAR